EEAIGLALTSGHFQSPDEVNAYLSANVQAYPSVRNFGWVSPEGRGLASSNPEGIGIDISDRDYFQQLLAGRQSVVSDLLQSRLHGSPTVVVVYAVRDNAGKLLGAVAAGIDPDRLGEVLSIQRSERGAVGIVDRQGMRVYRYPEMPLTWEQRDTGDG